MTKVSRIKIDVKHLGFFLNNFWNIITLLENKDQVKDFLKDLLTHTEMKMLAKRIQIAKMLIEGYNYQAIRNYVKVTDSTIARINNILETRGEGLKIAISYLEKIESDIEKDRMKISSDLQKRYPSYFLPEIITDAIGKRIKVHRKRSSVKKDISL
ncbi:MAG: YerC/YecD family TrpR-related protein [Patescibacteria group bacterium]